MRHRGAVGRATGLVSERYPSQESVHAPAKTRVEIVRLPGYTWFPSHVKRRLTLRSSATAVSFNTLL
ncbi:MAG: hypothetical protein E5W15_17795 [Mesorhizobium sp.]|uniref:hypothetical protein n=1 Tax=unclassified Mesorhizobium TaxID=325217 RepID=UPI000FD5EC9C|nr:MULTISPECIES: hypothetical protein [unclassified Mesorhizobium]RWF55217.1 MAG: hypothetical protein EOS66_13425 [Mesorhizobium sp.]RUW69131.1 hypothetical protein EOA28_26045 [Mesorhizobium sp. M2A.F.Ca.ET.067.02.1.1]RVD10896.1 hypothetical protein EN753_04645 [Mesorhizobium sp. M2A.F.Ca.ET.029.05.1.1]TIU57099.1 MAG: hypothetical protein E5W35_10525 [Mesorhizobium sp.]TIU68810.1 MAG: hypothetical protein E5W15_17795 [Mesorhizobium sp.]